MAKDDELEQAQEIIQVKTELHSLAKSFYSFVDEFKTYRERSEPKQLGIGAIVGIIASVMGIFALLFSTVIYISNSANAPVVAQLTQMTQAMSIIQNNTMQNANQGQLISKELSGIDKSVQSNEDTLRWIIFTENLPKQITQLQGKVEAFETNFKQHSHTAKGTQW